jgi:spore coat protein CotF
MQKQLARQYNEAALEALSEDLKSDLLYILSQEHEFQSAVFRAMHKRGWYEVKEVSLEEIRNTQKHYSDVLEDLH